ncbi:hypothetical protein Hanom_Chr11g01019581 [Helianthus anomalus]
MSSLVTATLVTAGSLQATTPRATTPSFALIPMLHTKRENSTQKTSLVGERAHLIYKPHIDCPYNRCGTRHIPCNSFGP